MGLTFSLKIKGSIYKLTHYNTIEIQKCFWTWYSNWKMKEAVMTRLHCRLALEDSRRYFHSDPVLRSMWVIQLLLTFLVSVKGHVPLCGIDLLLLNKTRKLPKVGRTESKIAQYWFKSSSSQIFRLRLCVTSLSIDQEGNTLGYEFLSSCLNIT